MNSADSDDAIARDAIRDHLGMERFGLRFASRGTEADYRLWRMKTSMRPTRIGIVASCLAWLGALGTISIAWPQSLPLASAWVLLLMFPAYAATMAMTYRESLSKWVMPTIALVHMGAGILIVGLCVWLVGSPNMIAGSTVIVVFYGFAIFRMTPAIAAVTVLSFVSMAQYFLADFYLGGLLKLEDFAGFSLMPWTAYLTAFLVCVALERVTREAFRNERIIENQQNALVDERAELSKFLSPEVSRMVRERGIGATLHQQSLAITVVCCDLHGFTRYTEHHGAEHMVLVLREYYETVLEIVRRHGGTVKDFAGDGVLILVGAPVSRADHAEAGLQLARELIGAVRNITNRMSTEDAPLGVGVGIASGLCAVGAIGSRTRLEYTAVGSPVNLAARLCEHSSDADILIASETARLVGRRTMWRAATIQLKGFIAPVPTFIESPFAGKDDECAPAFTRPRAAVNEGLKLAHPAVGG